MYNKRMVPKTIKFMSISILAGIFSFYSILFTKNLNDSDLFLRLITKVEASELVLTDRLVRLEGPINQILSEEVNEKLLYLNFKNKGKPIYMLINSPGGGIMAGRSIIDVMSMIDAPIYCQVVDRASSMAAMILMHCDHKIMLPSAYLLFHQPSMRRPYPTQLREIEVDLYFFKQYWKEICESTAKKMGLTYERFYESINNTWMLTAFQAKNAGFIDDIVTSVSCESVFGICEIPLYQEK